MQFFKILENKKSKSFFNKAKLIISKTISVKSLPDEIIKFQSNPYIRLLRVLGGVSLLLILTHKIELLDGIFL